ncbi:uncharacterized protein LOC117108077 [Anneissia japonica]|uniref:uncharacterized protein LOC117108077 n=1 Tax=Anneissia japonica TaxID=1529436 RepID=UPI00142555FF|nr:uncharacterized protein LOC117108077 [Anneissia japonica]
MNNSECCLRMGMMTLTLLLGATLCNCILEGQSQIRIGKKSWPSNERIYHYDEDSDGYISENELGYLRIMSNDPLAVFFRKTDLNGDGLLDQNELRRKLPQLK